MTRSLTLLSAVLGFTGVALGAFGAHGVKSMVEALPDGVQRLAWWETGARYHLFHALAVGLAAVLAAQVRGSSAPAYAAWCFFIGVTLFSGSLYVMTLTGVRALGAVTPLGGLFLLAGWALLARGAWLLADSSAS
jgi:uncharacterized membrane protein YgdD (TMEM256/DUF423 family)